ncbi:mediator of RNA polymerase II transcription subunit 15-like [Sebastes umbrosus]|nr:mediator of RNA polymerase II transcription subunit 15-like [Sebastes umbrosus]
MTKTGKPDSYWASILHQYAQGKYKFTTGKKPGARKWKAVMKRIDTCPLTPVFNQRPREYTIFGKKILCQCGYHKSAEQAGSSGSQQTEGESGSIAGRPQTAPATQSSSAASATQSSSAASATQSSSDAPTMQSSWSRSAARATQSSSAAFATQSSWSRSATSATQSRSAAPATQSSLSASRQTAAQIKCALCSIDISGDKFSEHLSDFHTDECCEQCGRKVSGAVGLLHHIEEHHHKLSKQPQLPCPPPPQQPPPPSRQQPPFPPPQQPPPPPPPTSPHVIILRPPEVNWVSFLPKQFMRVIQPADREWIAQCLYDPAGQLKQQLSQNWFHPPNPPKPATTLPDPMTYFRQRMFLWAPMRMWGIPLKCHQCNTKMHHSGIYTKVREVIDLDSRYYLVGGEYPRCILRC